MAPLLNGFTQIVSFLQLRFALDVSNAAVFPCQNMAQILPAKMFCQMVVVQQHVLKGVAFCRHQ